MRSARSGSTGCAAPACSDETFEPREGFEPTSSATRASRAIWYSKGDRALAGRARRAAAGGRRGARGARPVGSEEWLVGEILPLPGRGRRARAGRTAQARSPSARGRSHASCASAAIAAKAYEALDRQLDGEGRALARLGRTSSEPPCASVIERAMKSPRPVPGFELTGVARPNFSKITRWSSAEIPGPWSETLTAIEPLSRGEHLDLVADERVLDRVVRRFMTTWRIRSRSPRTPAAARWTCGGS